MLGRRHGTAIARTRNPFLSDPDHMGEMTVQQLVEIVTRNDEFPNGLNTVIRIGDVEGNNSVNGDVCLTYHEPGDIVLSIDPNAGDHAYFQSETRGE